MRVIAIIVCVCLLVGCGVPESCWRDLLTGTVRTRTVERDTLKVVFTDGGTFETPINRISDNQVAVGTGMTYIIQSYTNSNGYTSYRFVQRTAEDQRPGVTR